MKKRIILVGCLLPVVLAAGPCQMPEDVEDMESNTADGGPECTRAACEDRIEVNAVRADNSPFEDGAYRFTGLYPEGAFVESNCLYDTVVGELECQNAGMTAAMGNQGRQITLTFQGDPEWITVGVAYNHIDLGEIQIQPQYNETDPEDPACPFLCRTAEEIIAVERL
jgi:hypothetical protein